MRGTPFELIHDHVRAIHRALTGKDPPERAPPDEAAGAPSAEAVLRHFAELEALARSIPQIAERVPPFSFEPPLDVIGTEHEIIAELGVPGIEREDVQVEADGDALIVVGARPEQRPLDGRIYYHAEMPRGPFRRRVRLPPLLVSGPPRVEVERGVIRIRLGKATKSPLPRA